MKPAEPSRWLPPGAIKSKAARDAVARCVADWSAEWCARGVVEVADEWSSARPSAGFTDVGEKDGVAARYKYGPDNRLASMLLNRKLGPTDFRTELDKQLLERLVKAALGDLADRLRKVFPVAAGERGAVGNEPDILELGLVIDGKSGMASLSVSRTLLVDYVFKSSRSPRQAALPNSRRDALHDQPIRLSALVGRTSLELAELAEIGVGDVLLLDRPLTSSLDLMIDGQVQGSESASLSLDKDRLVLSIERDANQW